MISARSGETELTDILLTGENIDPDIQENVRLQTTSGNTIFISLPPSQNTGWSALFFSAERGDVTTTKSLIKAGANPHLRDMVCVEIDSSLAFHLIHFSCSPPPPPSHYSPPPPLGSPLPLFPSPSSSISPPSLSLSP